MDERRGVPSGRLRGSRVYCHAGMPVSAIVTIVIYILIVNIVTTEIAAGMTRQHSQDRHGINRDQDFTPYRTLLVVSEAGWRSIYARLSPDRQQGIADLLDKTQKSRKPKH